MINKDVELKFNGVPLGKISSYSYTESIKYENPFDPIKEQHLWFKWLWLVHMEKKEPRTATTTMFSESGYRIGKDKSGRLLDGQEHNGRLT